MSKIRRRKLSKKKKTRKTKKVQRGRGAVFNTFVPFVDALKNKFDRYLDKHGHW